MIDRSKRYGRTPCAPWEPTTAPNALTIEKLSRIEHLQRDRDNQEAALAVSLLDPAFANTGFQLIEFAWRHLSAAERARLLTIACTPEVRAAAETEKGWA